MKLRKMNMSEFDDYCEYCQCLSQAELNEEFLGAMDNNDIDRVKFLLSSPNLKEHADIHTQRDAAFRFLCISRNLTLINYFIFELNIEKTKMIAEHLESYKSSYRYSESMDCIQVLEQAELLFEKRDLINEINSELNVNSNTIKKSKL